MFRKFFVIAAAFALLAILSTAFNLPYASAGTLSPNEIMNADGTLNLTNGKSGNVDVRDWNVGLDPQRGPVLTSNAPTADGWAKLNNGMNGNVLALAVDGNNVYVGGDFQSVCTSANCIGQTRVNNIAKWDGSAWSALGFGVKGNVRAIAVQNGDVLVGGNFSHVCGNSTCDSGNTRVNNIARFTTGNVWLKLFHGVNDSVNALAAKGNDLYVGGAFTHVCGNDTCMSDGNLRVNRIAKWSGSSWSGFAFGVNKEVQSVAAIGNIIYIGGIFEVACGTAICDSQTVTIVNGVAKWNGSAWMPLHFGVNGFVFKVLVTGTSLIHVVYVGGTFSAACGNVTCSNQNVTMNNIARWDGSNWAALGGGVSNIVFSLASNADGLYVGGDFSNTCGNATCNNGNLKVNRIAKWTGANWSALGNGLSGEVLALAAKGSDVYAGGAFKTVCGNADCNSNNFTVNRVAKYGAVEPPPPTPTPSPTPPQTPSPTPTTPNGCNAKPDKPALKAPAVNGALAKTQVPLKWNDVTCETKYQVVVKQQDPKTTAFKKTLGADVTKVKTTALTVGKTYKWFVKACNSFGCTKSETRTFTLNP